MPLRTRPVLPYMRHADIPGHSHVLRLPRIHTVPISMPPAWQRKDKPRNALSRRAVHIAKNVPQARARAACAAASLPRNHGKGQVPLRLISEGLERHRTSGTKTGLDCLSQNQVPMRLLIAGTTELHASSMATILSSRDAQVHECARAVTLLPYVRQTSLILLLCLETRRFPADSTASLLSDT
jgi:hypothetical protein